MSKFFNFLTGRKKQSQKDHVDSKMQKRTKTSDIECKVVHLDSTDFTFYLDRKAYGTVLEDFTYHQIEVSDDKNYFGLQYTDKKNINHWLDMSKQVRKQCEIGPPYTLRFRVKFFSSDPSGQMHDEYTRYLFVLQLKQMIRDGELLCENMELAAELAALSLQGELGDYDEREHTPLFISQYRFIPESQQTERFELLVLEKYKLFKDRNIIPLTTDRQYLDKCRSLPDYGVDRHNIKGKNDKDYVLGLTPTGILIYEDNTKIGLFQWNQVTKLSFKKSRFKIVIRDVQEDDLGEIEHTFVFKSVDVAACKQMWKSCVENHAFYRLEGSHKPPTKFQQLFRLKSRFYASFHTEYQMAVKNTFGSSTRRNSTFQRTPSLRGAPRASFERNELERRKIQQKNRERVREDNKAAAIKKLNSTDQSDSNESTPTPIKKNRPPPTPNKIDLTTNMYQNKTPRIYSQDSTITNASTISRHSSVDTSTSESSDPEVVHSKKLIPKNAENCPIVPPKPNLTKVAMNANNPRPPSRPAYVPQTSQRTVKPSPRPRVSNGFNQEEIILV